MYTKLISCSVFNKTQWGKKIKWQTMDNCKLTLIHNGFLPCTSTSPWPAFSLPPHSQAHMAVPSPPPDHTGLLSTHSLFSAFPPQGPCTYFPSAWNDLSSQASLTLRLSHFFRTHPPTKFFPVCSSNHSAMVMAEFQSQCSHVHTKSYIVFLCWRFQCSWTKAEFRMWWKLSWSIYMQNILFLI